MALAGEGVIRNKFQNPVVLLDILHLDSTFLNRAEKKKKLPEAQQTQAIES